MTGFYTEFVVEKWQKKVRLMSGPTDSDICSVAYSSSEAGLCKFRAAVHEGKQIMSVYVSVCIFTCRGPGFDVASAMYHRVLRLSFFWRPKAIPDHQTHAHTQI